MAARPKVMTSEPKPNSVFPMLIASAGIGLTLLLGVAFVGAIKSALFLAQEAVGAGASPQTLAATIGEAVISVAALGVYAILPTLLIFLALVPMKFRRPWFYRLACLSAVFFLVLVPVGSICGMVLLLTAKRRRAEFFPAPAVLTPPLTAPQPNTPT